MLYKTMVDLMVISDFTFLLLIKSHLRQLRYVPFVTSLSLLYSR